MKAKAQLRNLLCRNYNHNFFHNLSQIADNTGFFHSALKKNYLIHFMILNFS